MTQQQINLNVDMGESIGNTRLVKAVHVRVD
jgi:lactam utilization protein B